ncbi:ABC transporter ATP-binding protein [Vibrio sp. Of7-15]|uniref:ABC transporter ATP-binding protein n=1 Tax=Vibrio sp. Of7-15 TaxID=2724879 RepID=UPI001EF21F81|nr:ABC transporter ATP-binding protein [Vibrio sp. Of7-15]MCG7496009.1 ABC transporter ATP-binding protein [Vibrio sp. Of7-15]
MHLQITNLTWSVSDKSILNDIDLNVAQGQFVGLIGPNGSGKSSLLRCAYRRHKPSRGQILLNQKDIHTMPAKTFARHVAVVQQEFPAEFGFTVEEVVKMGLTPHQSLFSSVGVGKKRVIEALDKVGLAHIRAQSFDLLSGGEKQRCLLARALVQEPELLILDEPTNHLDIHYQFELLDLVKSLGISVLATLHDLNISARYCDYLYVMQAGNITQQGTPSQVLTPEVLADNFSMAATVDQQVHSPVPRINYLEPIS